METGYLNTIDSTIFICLQQLVLGKIHTITLISIRSMILILTYEYFSDIIWNVSIQKNQLIRSLEKVLSPYG